jgi:hypothetical protein
VSLSAGQVCIGAREVGEFFFELERELGLLDRQFAQVPLWGLSRVSLAFELISRIDETRPVPKALGGGRFRRWRRELADVLLANPLLASQRPDVVILEHPRAVDWDGRLVDIYSDPVERELGAKGVAYRALSPREPSGQSKTPDPKRSAVRAVDILGRMLRGDGPPRLHREDAACLREVARRASLQFRVSWPVTQLLQARLPSLVARFRGYRALLGRWQPTRLYATPAYTEHGPAVCAARSLGIHVTELQHGFFGPHHLGYAYPGRTRPLSYFPDELQVWSESWKARVPFSEQLATVTIRPSEWLASRLARYGRVTKEPAVVVLSQPTIGVALAAAVEALLPRWEGRKVYYKLHPGEHDRFETYAALSRMRRANQVEVVVDGGLHELLGRCEIQVGVFSTAIHEGLEFGCRTLLINLPGVEAMHDLVASGQAELIEPPEAAASG